MRDLDCANCAAKMERAVSKIRGVQSASISFLAQKISIEAEESQFDAIMKDVVKACKKVDPSCEIEL